jgi:CheY-like chemotaxis protein
VSVDVAENGLEGVAKRQQNEYDLVLMDVQMPIMDGYTATREIRAWEKACNVRRTPILAVTAHALNGAAAASLAAGCDAHLTKPLERHELIEAITKFANQPVTRAESLPDMILARRPAFLANRQLDLEKMRTALAAQDFTVIQKIAHNCKGIGRGYGFPPISEIGASLDKAARAQDAELLRKLMDDFEGYVGLALQDVAA